MAVFNWRAGTERYERIRALHRRLLRFSFDAFAQPPRHPKWQEINLAAEMPGWNRYLPAQEWLDRNPRRRRSRHRMRKLLSAFKAFLEASGDAQALSAADQEELFKRFLEWRAAGAQ